MKLEVENINKAFRSSNIISDMSFSINDNEYLCIVGDSGCGKTTLLNIITGMLKPDSGIIKIDDIRVAKRRWSKIRNTTIGYLPCGNSLIESLTIYDNIKCAAKLYNKSDYDISALLKELKIDGITKAHPSEISSGEYKRACFARVLSLDTNFLVLDEPTSNLDSNSAGLIINILNKLSSKKGIIIATHDNRLIQGKSIHL